MSDTTPVAFTDLDLAEPLLRVLKELGYEVPSPIQAATIPILQSGRDVLGQAQTGTGKTAAFALPVLSRIDVRKAAPQALVLAPTRELAIQVAEAFQRYATYLPGFHVMPIYGGQAYGPQLSALRRGVHVVVGTPGRVIDHLEKGSLDLSQLRTLVLDEADEMLRMGFIDEVEAILQKTPATRQTALFSATMPSAIKRIANTYLRDPAEVTIAAKTGTAENIRQRFWLVSGMHKLDALTRILEAENFDGMIIFARTKLGTEELAAKLQARGFSAAAINGDMAQQARERTIGQLKDGQIDILVATDVAARGLDVERISHVINYDVPHDPESYTHRIGRTGRAGRSGEAILFITPRERGLLKAIERATRQPVSPLELPSIQMVNDVRVARFKDQITDTLAQGGLEMFQSLLEDYEREKNVPMLEIASALAKLARGDVPLLLEKGRRETPVEPFPSDAPPRAAKFERERPAFAAKERIARAADPGKRTYRIAVGHQHGVKPGNIVGAIANEIGMDGKLIGRIEIYDDYTLLDLPDDVPDDLMEHLQGVRVAGQALRIRADDGAEPTPTPARPAAARPAAAPRAPQAGGALAPYRIAVGHQHGVKPGNIVGAIANELGMDAKLIGRIEIEDDYSLIDLPADLSDDLLAHLQGVRVAGQSLRAQPVGAQAERPRAQPAARLDAIPFDQAPPPVAETRPKKDKAAREAFPVKTYRIEVGHAHEAKPANIVGAIANEAGLEARYIGRIDIFDDHSLIDLPDGMPKELLQHLKSVWVAGQQLKISPADPPAVAARKPALAKAPGKKERKKY